MMPPVFVDAKGLAERLDVSYDTVLTWVRRGRLPHVRDGKNRLMFNLTTVIDSLRQQDREVASATPVQEGGQ
jgi:excisionase family DNA binding protein